MAGIIASESDVGDVALDQDARTEAVVMIGEIGGAMEEEAAEYAHRMTKPMVAFIAGAASPPGKRMGHAGAIVMGNRGTYAAKRDALEGAGVAVLPTPGDKDRIRKASLPGVVNLPPKIFGHPRALKQCEQLDRVRGVGDAPALSWQGR
jgi:succinyl-CoA synthetase alpha subunit